MTSSSLNVLQQSTSTRSIGTSAQCSGHSSSLLVNGHCHGGLHSHVTTQSSRDMSVESCDEFHYVEHVAGAVACVFPTSSGSGLGQFHNRSRWNNINSRPLAKY